MLFILDLIYLSLGLLLPIAFFDYTFIKEICDYDFQEVHCGCNKK